MNGKKTDLEKKERKKKEERLRSGIKEMKDYNKQWINKVHIEEIKW